MMHRNQKLLLKLFSVERSSFCHIKNFTTEINPNKGNNSTSTNNESANLILKKSCDDGKIVRLILNSPKTRNSLSLSMLEALKHGVNESCKLSESRVIILAAEPPVFSAGHDLKELISKHGSDYHKKIFDTCSELMTSIQTCRLPVLAEVKSMAAAAGCQLIASCDIVIAGESAKFATPGSKAGIFCSTPGIAVARSVPMKVALDMVLVGDPINARDALRAGLVSRVVSDEKVEDTTMEIARKICSLSKPVVELGKKFFYEQIRLSTQEAYKRGENVMVENLRLIDAQEGLEAFIKKRKPVWSHKEDTCF